VKIATIPPTCSCGTHCPVPEDDRCEIPFV
jgi:hypothetical protein